MEWTGALGVAAAALAVLGAASALYRRVARRAADLQQRIGSIESSLRTSARARTTRALCVYHNGSLVSVPKGTSMLVQGWDGRVAQVLVEPWGVAASVPTDALEPE